MIDLRSDTVTQPSPGMREAIARAKVGDDSLGDDPTTIELEAAVAALLAKEAALFFPTGIMANETALQVLGVRGTEVIVEANSHLFDWELGAAGTWAGVQLRPVTTPDGLLTADLVERAIRPPLRLQLETSAICLENTHSASGGRVMALEQQRSIIEIARRHQLAIHLDGARIWNASAASGHSVTELAAGFDTVMVTLSKGLGCPVGSLLGGTQSVIDRARWIRRRMGGAMRQAGIIAAAGLYALEHNQHRLADDHRRARTLARLAGTIAGLRVIEPETNIVMMDVLRPDLDATAVVASLRKEGILLVEITARRVRAVTHLDIDDDAIHAAATALAKVFS